MSKWKCEICGLEFENFHAQGFNHTIYCPLCYYKELYKINTQKINRYKLIIKALHKHFTKQEEYENNEFLRQLENCNENDMIWLKRMAGDKE